MAGGSTGVLLIHGYLATPEEMRGLAQHLSENSKAAYNAVSGFIARIQGGDWIWK